MQWICLKVFPEEETFNVANSNNIKNPAILQTYSRELGQQPLLLSVKYLSYI